MKTMKNILLIDFGSTYTKVTAVDLEEERLVGTASSYTTVAVSYTHLDVYKRQLL